MSALDKAYQCAATQPSDIYQHVPTLKSLVTPGSSVTEFGIGNNVSTVGLLAGRPLTYIGYDAVERPCLVLRALAEIEGISLTIHCADTLKLTSIEYTDLLFIDTLHTEAQLEKELLLSPYVRKFIALHDTETFGRAGENGGRGLMYAVESFLEKSPEWRLMVHYSNCNGFTVLERVHA